MKRVTSKSDPRVKTAIKMARKGLSDHAIMTVTGLTKGQIWYWVYTLRGITRRDYRNGTCAYVRRLCRMLAETRELKARVDNLIHVTRIMRGRRPRLRLAA